MRFLAVAALLVLSVGGCWLATQYVASALAYAPALGPPWATLGEERLYAPWQWIVWARLYAPRAPILFRNAGAITTARRPGRCRRGRDGGPAAQALGQ